MGDFKIYENMFGLKTYPILHHSKQRNIKFESHEQREKVVLSWIKTDHTSVVVDPEMIDKVSFDDLHKRTDVHIKPPTFLNIFTSDELDELGIMRDHSMKRYTKGRGSSRMKNAILRVMQSGVKLGDFWDERLAFRFYSLNKFLSLNYLGTFGDYLAEHAEAVYKDFCEMKAVNTETRMNKLLDAYIKNGFALRFDPSSSEKDLRKIYSLSQADILAIIDINRARDFTQKMSLFPYSKRLEETVSIARLSIEDKNKLFKDLSANKIANDIADEFRKAGIDVNKENGGLRYVFSNSIETLRSALNDWGIVMARYSTWEIHKKLVESDIDPVKKFAMRIVMAYPKFFFDRLGNKGAIELERYMKKFGVEDFTDFCYDVLMNFDGKLPSLKDWEDYFESISKIDKESPAALLLYVISSNDGAKNRGMVEVEKWRKVIRAMELVRDRIKTELNNAEEGE